MSLKSSRKGNFDPVIESAYGGLFRAQMNKDWNAVDTIQKAIRRLETREGQMATDTQDLRDYEGAVR